MAIMAGTLRHRVIIEQLTTGQDAAGGVTESWTTFKTVWADISPLNNREFWEAQKINPEITGRVRVRYQDGFKSNMRIKYGTRYFYIVTPINPKEKNEILELYYKEAADYCRLEYMAWNNQLPPSAV